MNAVSTTFAAVTIDGDAQRAEVVLDTTAETATFTFAQPIAVGRAPAAHRLYGADQQVRPRPVLRRLPDRRRHQADALEQARTVGRAADLSVLGRARVQGDFRARCHGAAPFVAVGNMPVAREEPVAPDLKRVAFAPTPKMSSYLFVLTVGELERITAEVGRRHRRRRRDRGQGRARAVSRSTARPSCWPISTTISASNIRCPNSI